MTRYELKKYANGYVKEGMKIVIDELIDTISDDIESRTCENCKWYELSHDNSLGWCNSRAIDFEDKLIHKSFGCNKFERKLD